MRYPITSKMHHLGHKQHLYYLRIHPLETHLAPLFWIPSLDSRRRWMCLLRFASQIWDLEVFFVNKWYLMYIVKYSGLLISFILTMYSWMNRSFRGQWSTFSIAMFRSFRICWARPSPNETYHVQSQGLRIFLKSHLLIAFRGGFCIIIPQIAIAIGVLTSNRGGGRRTTLADWTWHQGAIAGCHRRVPL